MQNIMVGVIVILAAVYLCRRFYNSVKKTRVNACGCACDSCSDTAATCEQVTGPQRDHSFRPGTTGRK